MNKEEILELYPWPKSFNTNGKEVIDTFTKVPLKSSADTIWGWLSDSSRINRALGMGERIEIERNGQLIVRTKMLGVVQEWVEYPWNWVSGESIIVDREYNTGFAEFNHSVFYFKENYLYIYMGFTANSMFSKTLLSVGVKSVVDNLANLLSEMDAELAGGRAVPSYFIKNTDELNEEQKSLLAERLDLCKELEVPDEIISKIYDLVCVGDELDLYRIRTKELSDKWAIEETILLKAFLIATKVKVFNMSWDVICPSCLGPRSELSQLVDLLNVDHCDACRLKFETDGENIIEITFKINPDIRKVRKLQFCAAEPARKKHIKIQWNLSDILEKRQVELESGNYKLRVLGEDIFYYLKVCEEGNDIAQIENREGSLVLTNNFSINLPEGIKKGILIIERDQKDPYAVRPRDIFGIPNFKKLFSEQKIGQGVQLYLGEQTILFTDIISSTKYYELFGDKYAYEEIRKHFSDIESIFEQNNGLIVKTIGDAVMAAFKSPLDALKACEDAHKVFDKGHSKYNFLLRMSAHVGKVIGVNLDTGIDYFGNTVNVAAKLQRIADDHQFGISSDFFKHLKKEHLVSWNIEKKIIDIPGKKEKLDAITLTYKEI